MIIEDNIKQQDMPKAKVKDLYVIEFTKSRILWSIVIALLILTFIFTFGYWTGSYNTRVDKKLNDISLVGSKDDIMKDMIEIEKNDESAKLQKNESKANNDKSNLFAVNTESENSIKDSKTDVKQKIGSTESLSKVESQRVNLKKVNDINQGKKSVINKSNSVKKTDNKKFFIQFASFNSKDKAIKLKENLHNKGYNASIVQSGGLYKVRIGGFSDYNSAANTVSKVMQEFKVKDAYIIKVK
ncbi:MAG TPA: SPOR domain-containing protein [Spirochaetota bacterium]|nr:SPOR domain-containing protein [Spirochaetota bacterium]HOM38929.1 SPOR domain-containing protein [Spirochaetota bacterium]HPQ49185.1 SPOR domain-containing protein [Spirochaetota bacterium]